jgi:hypothetical protein
MEIFMVLNSFRELTLSDSELLTEMKRVRKSVYKSDKHRLGFQNSANLSDWWVNQMKTQQACCDYCKTPIKLIRILIENNLLAGRPVKRLGVRGPNLELERMDHKIGYTPLNCVLICYYCNNDKSNVYSRAEYMEFLAPAKHQHFMALAKQLPKNKAA